MRFMKTVLLAAALFAALPARGAPDPLTDPRRDIVGAELDLLPVAISAADGNAKDFSEFHKYVAVLWQRQVTAEKLAQVFKPFTDSNLNLLPLDNYSPVFDGTPSINEDGVLVIKGHYPTKPSKVLFQLKYV